MSYQLCGCKSAQDTVARGAWAIAGDSIRSGMEVAKIRPGVPSTAGLHGASAEAYRDRAQAAGLADRRLSRSSVDSPAVSASDTDLRMAAISAAWSMGF